MLFSRLRRERLRLCRRSGTVKCWRLYCCICCQIRSLTWHKWTPTERRSFFIRARLKKQASLALSKSGPKLMDGGCRPMLRAICVGGTLRKEQNRIHPMRCRFLTRIWRSQRELRSLICTRQPDAGADPIYSRRFTRPLAVGWKRICRAIQRTEMLLSFARWSGLGSMLQC